ncbi:ester cyclase [Streptomyces sp. NPDC050423]|uniref:ester cyclase n=1 Tax=Streptomyces sp. NPDC050423 TaxID=3155402 RepID=UPI003426B877
MITKVLRRARGTGGMSVAVLRMRRAVASPVNSLTESVFQTSRTAHLDQLQNVWLTYADPNIEVLDGFEVDDRAVAKWQASGTVTAELPGIWTGEAVGEEFSFTGVTLARFDDNGLIREDVEVWNLAALSKQLGLLPS